MKRYTCLAHCYQSFVWSVPLMFPSEHSRASFKFLKLILFSWHDIRLPTALSVHNGSIFISSTTLASVETTHAQSLLNGANGSNVVLHLLQMVYVRLELPKIVPVRGSLLSWVSTVRRCPSTDVCSSVTCGALSLFTWENEIGRNARLLTAGRTGLWTCGLGLPPGWLCSVWRSWQTTPTRDLCSQTRRTSS